MSIFNKRTLSDSTAEAAASHSSGGSLFLVSESKEATPLSSMPFKTSEPDSVRRQANIGKAVKIVGQIYSKEDLYVDGAVEGTIEVQDHRLTIGPNGTVHSIVKAREFVILGSIQGNVDASDKVEIRKDANVVGDIKTPRIVIEDGAYIKGRIDSAKPEPAKSGATWHPGPPVTLVAATAS